MSKRAKTENDEKDLETKRREGGFMGRGTRELFPNEHSPCNFWSTDNWRHLKPLSDRTRSNLCEAALMTLALGDDAELMNLIERGVDVNAVVLNHGETLLHQSVCTGMMSKTELLLMNGASPNLAMLGGHTPLHLASEKTDTGSLQLVELLLSWGANPLARDYEGKTPFDVASSEEKKKLLTKWMEFRKTKQPIKLLD